jgi:excisionase family DNA binding protein
MYAAHIYPKEDQMATAVSSERLLRIDEAARLLGVSSKTVRRWIELDGLPVHRLGPRSPRINEAELREWIGAR